ncbi:MAG: O-antigen ligase family protein [Candidatus Azambacteria bacterium]|nr:O-antigen ligase family protein [Candidatus Azambacteria bacterium]
MSNILIKLIKFGIGFILFIPLYIGGSFYFPFIFSKIWLFQLVIEIILFLYIILMLIDARFRPKWNLVIGTVALLTATLVITGFTGIDVFRSFWGNTERMSGIISWFHLVAFSVILFGVFKTEKDWRKFFGIAVFVSILEFFYVLAQYLGISWVWLPHSQIGTIGNADLLGSYAIFSAFFALYLWQGSKFSAKGGSAFGGQVPSSKFRWFWATAFFMNIVTLYLAGSRGAMLGFGAGLFVFMIFNVWRDKNNLKIWAIIAGCLIVVYGVLFISRDTNFIRNNYQLARITHISIQDTTVQQRFVEWGIAWEAFKAKPVFGFGPNNYLYLHNAFLNPRVYILQETNFDRAHNAYLDYASMSGIFGLLGYLILIGVLFWVFLKNKSRIFASLVVAYAIQSFFVFDSPASYFALFLTIGFAMFMKNSKSPPAPRLWRAGEIQNSKQIQNSNFKSQTVLAISIFYFLFSIFLIWQVSIKPAAANIKFVRAFNNASLGPYESYALYKESLATETLGTSEFRLQFVNWLQRNIANFKPEDRLEVFNFGIDQLEKEAKNHPSVFTYLNLGQIYNFKGRGVENAMVKAELFKKSAGSYDKALELSPKRLEIYISYLQLSFDEKNYDQGIEMMKRAVSFIPDYPNSHWYLGLAYTASGAHETEAAASISEALSLWYKGKVVLENGRLKYDLNDTLKIVKSFVPKQEILGAVNPYIKLKMWPELLLLYLSAEKGDPEDIQLHQSLALVYQNLGLAEKVNEELRIVENLEQKAVK